MECKDKSIAGQYINKGRRLSVFTLGVAGVKNRSELSRLKHGTCVIYMDGV